jgi:hypothetical protein
MTPFTIVAPTNIRRHLAMYAARPSQSRRNPNHSRAGRNSAAVVALSFGKCLNGTIQRASRQTPQKRNEQMNKYLRHTATAALSIAFPKETEK